MANGNLAASQANFLDLANFHLDAEASLRLYFTSINPHFVVRFAGLSLSEVREGLANRIHETDMRSALAVMTYIEAVFRLDYKWRRDAKRSDSVSIAFRKHRRMNVRLDEDIWETWKGIHPATGPLISQLRSVFRFRHWLAHGRYWHSGQKYDFQTLYGLAQVVLTDFPLFK